MNLFSTDYKLARLQKSAGNAVSMFTKALDNLTEVNSKIDSHIDETIEKINQHQKFVDNLNQHRDTNNKIIGKIKAILD